MRTFPGWSLTFDEVPPSSSARSLARITGVDLKRVPPKSRPAALWLGFPRANRQPARTPPSTFLFLPIHLSNSPEPGGSTLRNRRAAEVPCFRPKSDAGSAYGSAYREELRRRAEPPRRTAHRNRLYSPRPRALSTLPPRRV